jgi:MoaA/NifB/PqqE/SkfB family radical SAM enzyme
MDVNIKGMLWTKYYEAIEHNLPLPPPVAISLDLTDICNLRCYWCNSKRMKNILSFEYVKELVDILHIWGVKGVCLGGGGEPCLNSYLGKIAKYITSLDMDVGIITNGTELTKDLADILVDNSKFCSVSLDSATKETWMKLKGLDERQYNKLRSNIAYLCKIAKDKRVDTTAKFLVVPENQYEIYQFVLLAKNIGFKSVLIRPADLSSANNPITEKKVFDVAKINEQLLKAKDLESSDFRIYPNFGRQKEDGFYSPKNTFKKCYASPIHVMCLANKYAYICANHKWEDRFKLCKSLDIVKYWNSKEHRELLRSIIPCRDCRRCSFGNYNQMAELYLDDIIIRNIP